MTNPENTPLPAEGQPAVPPVEDNAPAEAVAPANAAAQAEAVAPAGFEAPAAPASFEAPAAPASFEAPAPYAPPAYPHNPAAPQGAAYPAAPGYPQAPAAPQAPAGPQGAGYPQAPAASQGAGYPGAPVPAMAMPGATPQAAPQSGPTLGDQVNSAVAGVKTSPYGKILKHLWRGETGEALDLGDKTKNLWIPVLSVVVGFGSLVYAFILGRMAGQAGALLFGGSSFGRFAERHSYYMGFSAGSFFRALIGLMLIFVATLALRAAALMLTAKLRKKEYSFLRALNLLAVAYLPSLAMLLGFFVLVVLPGTIMLRLTVLTIIVVLLPMALLSELLIYVGFNRQNGFTKSVLIPHVAMSMATWGLALLFSQIVISIFD